jgi:uncharacterized protein YacL
VDGRTFYWMIVGGLSAYGLVIPESNFWLKILFIPLGMLGGWLFYTVIFKNMVNLLIKMSGQELLIKGAGLIFGLILSALFSIVFKPFIDPLPPDKRAGLLVLLFMLFTGLTGMVASAKVKEQSFNLVTRQNPLRTPSPVGNQFKILDTSAIIDGRIADLCKTGFLEGVLVVPNFVLGELQKIADSADALRRNRGRRGLDLLNRMQKENQISIKVFDRDYEEISEVDTKILKLAREMGAKVVTNDFNLNKVAELYGVQVLNINELSNAIKPLVLPGEEMMVHVLRDGKEYGQGIGYLDDGTMIVVEGGRNFIGLDIEILVTSVLQTSAGRMIFAKPKEVLMTKVTS